MTYIHLSSTCIKITQWPKIKTVYTNLVMYQSVYAYARALTHNNLGTSFKKTKKYISLS